MPVVLLGDFNIPFTNDNLSKDLPMTLPGPKLPIMEALISLISEADLSQLNPIYNRHGTLLDLVLASLPLTVNAADSSAVGHTDDYHPPLLIRIPTCTTMVTATADRSWNYSKANIPGLRATLLELDWTPVTGAPDLDSAAHAFSRLVIDSMALHIPLTGPRAFPSFPRWFSAELCATLRRKTKLHRKKSTSPANYAAFSAARASASYLLERDKHQEARRLESIFRDRPQEVYALCKSGCRADPTLVQPDGSLSSDPEIVANQFADHYQSVYPAVADPPTSAVPPLAAAPVRGPSAMFAAADIISGLRRFKVARTSIPGSIPGIILKSCGDLMTLPLLHLFNSSINLSYFPHHWKRGITVPIFKSGLPTTPANYRPVTILPPVAMLFELLAFRTLEADIPVVFPGPEQHGFTSGRSTTTNLADFTAFLSDEVESRGQVDVLYLDISRAFDLMNHHLLLEAMMSMGLSPHWASWTWSYLTDREYRVRVSSAVSTSTIRPSSGIAQGSSGGPLLYKIFVHNLPDAVRDSISPLFADDTKLAKSIASAVDVDIFQSSIWSALRWFESRKLPINFRKIALVSFSRKRPPITATYYDLSGREIRREDHVKDLGVTFSCDLRFSRHSELARLKSLRTLGCLTHATAHLNISSPKVLTGLFTSLVLSKMTYASAVWSNITAEDIRRLDVVINRFCRTVRHRNPSWHHLHTSDVRTLLGLFPSISNDFRVAEASLALSILSGRSDSPSMLARINFRVPDIRTRNHGSDSFMTDPRGANPINRATAALDSLSTDFTRCSRADLLKAEFDSLTIPGEQVAN
jgi:hypothetical protein